MRNTYNSRVGAGLACLFLLWGTAWSPAHAGKTAGQTGQVQGQTGQVGGQTGQVAPVLTTRLLVNGAAVNCGATVASGDQVCLLFTSDQSGTAVVTIRVGAGANIGLASGSVAAGTTYGTCVTAGTADAQTRIFTVTVTNAAGLSTSQQCAYVVAGKKAVGGQTGKTGPVLTTSLLANGAAATCGANVAAQAQVCLQYASDQAGTVVVMVRSGTGMDTVLAMGSIAAGTTYSTCVNSGAADGQLRTFTVVVTTASGQSSTQTCTYGVQ